MIQVDVITIDNQRKRFLLKATKENIICDLENESPTIVLSDERDTVWFPKQHVIRVEIREQD